MSTLSASSTRAQVLDEYSNTCSYEEDADAAKCRRFITAVRMLLSPRHSLKRSAHGGRGGEEVELDLVTLRQELTAAQSWLAGAIAAGSGSVVHADFTGFRE